MATVVNLRSGSVFTKGFIGFSWTTLFFGILVPLFRGDWKWFLIMVIAMIVTCGLSNILFWFIYNRIYTKNLILEKGFVPADDHSRQLLMQSGMILP